MLPFWRTGNSSLSPARCSPAGCSPRSSRGACACPACCSSSSSGWPSAPTAWASSTSTTTARAPHRDHRAGADPLRGRTDLGAARDPPGARRRRSAWPSSGRSSPRWSPASSAAWLFDLSTLDGLLLGSVLAATDGAAIFALLRGSTLKRRLATHAGGRVGLQRSRRGPARARASSSGSSRTTTAWRTWPCSSSASSASASPSASWSGVAAVWALRRVTAGHRGPVPGGDARGRRARLRRRRRAARVGLPRRLPGRARARHGRRPRPADGDLLPPGPGVGRRR